MTTMNFLQLETCMRIASRVARSGVYSHRKTNYSFVYDMHASRTNRFTREGIRRTQIDSVLYCISTWNFPIHQGAIWFEHANVTRMGMPHFNGVRGLYLQQIYTARNLSSFLSEPHATKERINFPPTITNYVLPLEEYWSPPFKMEISVSSCVHFLEANQDQGKCGSSRFTRTCFEGTRTLW